MSGSSVQSSVQELAEGDAGGISIDTNSLILDDGAAISADTFGRW